MNNKAIGVFDSGVGGLTVVRALLETLPNEEIVYFGDTARVPYGTKSPSSILQFADENTKFLISKNVKLIVVACNTATAIALPKLQADYKVPVIGVIEPGADKAAASTINKKIGVIGTVRTVKSGAYSTAIEKIDPSISVFSTPCPLFVPLIEENWVDHEVTSIVIREYLDILIGEGIDTLVLGCTHYPLISEAIRKCYPGIKIVDSAVSTALMVKKLLDKNDINRVAELTFSDRISIYLSDFSETFQELGERILKQKIIDNLHKVDVQDIS